MFGSWPSVVLFQESGAWTHRQRCYSFTKLTPRPTGSCGSTSIAKLQLLPQLNPHSGGQSGPRTARSHLVVCVCTALSQKHACPRTSAHRGAVCAHGKVKVVMVTVDWYRLSSELLLLWKQSVTLHSCTWWSRTCTLISDERWQRSLPAWYLHCQCHGTGLDLVQLHVVEPYLHVDQRWGSTSISTT